MTSTATADQSATLADRRAAVFARSTDAVLFHAVEMLEAKADAGTPLTPEENTTRHWVLDELERRHPEADAAMNAWAESDAPARDYTATLRRAILGDVDPVRQAATVRYPQRPPVGAPSPMPDAEREARRAERVAVVARRRTLAERYPGRVHLIGAGSAVGIPAGDLRPGDVRLYNYGSTATVLEVRSKGKASVVIVTDEDGQRYERTARKASLIAISDRLDENL